MGFFANIIQDSKRAITTDVRVPAVIKTPVLAPVSNEGVNEVMRFADLSKPVKGSELRTQTGMPLKTNSGLKTKRGRPHSTTNPKQIQAVQQENAPSPDVIQASMVFPKSVPNPGSQSIGVAPLQETHTLPSPNNTTQPQGKMNSRLVKSRSSALVPKDSTTLPPPHEHRETRPSESSDERGRDRQTTRPPKSNGEFIGALRTTEHTHGQDWDAVDDAQEISVVEATDVHHASTEVSVPARPDKTLQDKPDAKHAEQAAIAKSTHVQIGQINIIVEKPSDSKHQPVKLPSSNDLASRTFLRSL